MARSQPLRWLLKTSTTRSSKRRRARLGLILCGVLGAVGAAIVQAPPVAATSPTAFTGETPIEAPAPTRGQCGAGGGLITIPWVVGVEYFINGQWAIPGYHEVTGTLIVTAEAKPGYVLTGVTVWTFTAPLYPGRQLNLDYDCDSWADLVSVEADGRLAFRAGGPTGGLGSAVIIGSDWGGFTAITSPGAQRPSGSPPIWARTSDGRLLAYTTWIAGSDQGLIRGVAYDRVIGTGWGGISALTPAGDIDGDGNGDLYGRTRSGDLYLYYGNGTGIARQRLVGTGWNGLDAIFGGFDATGDTLNDVIGRDRNTGLLRLYPATAAGTPTGSGRVIGNGWGFLNSLTTLASLNGGGRLLGILPDRRLQAYEVSNLGIISGPTTIATNWSPKTLMW